MQIFNPITDGMGVGLVGVGDPSVNFKRKFRWTVEMYNPNGSLAVPAYFAKVAARPNISFEETEINFLNDKKWIPGKATWEAITVTYLDAANTQQDNTGLYSWLMSVFDFSSTNSKRMSSSSRCFTKQMVITMWDGCGSPLERWSINDAWPQAINFGDLDYTSSDIAEIELTVRYSQVSYLNICGPNPVAVCCGCGSK